MCIFIKKEKLTTQSDTHIEGADRDWVCTCCCLGKMIKSRVDRKLRSYLLTFIGWCWGWRMDMGNQGQSWRGGEKGCCRPRRLWKDTLGGKSIPPHPTAALLYGHQTRGLWKACSHHSTDQCSRANWDLKQRYSCHFQSFVLTQFSLSDPKTQTKILQALVIIPTFPWLKI